jgi:cytochrome P450
MRPSAAVQVPAPALLSEGLSRDPYAVYTALRAAGPVVWSDEALGGAWMLTRYAEIVATLSCLEASIAFQKLFAGVPLIRCLDPEPQWVENAVFRGLRSLRIARTEARDGLGPPLAAPR